MNYILRSVPYPNWEITIGDGPLFIGSGAKNQLAPQQPSVSEQHAVIQITDGTLWLTDLKSIAGTFVNGIQVQQAELKPGDEVAFGESRWRVDGMAAPISPVTSNVQHKRVAGDEVDSNQEKQTNKTKFPEITREKESKVNPPPELLSSPEPPPAKGSRESKHPEPVPMDTTYHPIKKGDDYIPKDHSEVLLEAARLDLYRVNAFRVMELPVDATPRDLAKRQQIVEMSINTGLPVPPGSGRALPLQETSDSNALREAVQRLRDPERRLVDEFFWFWPHKLNKSSSDEALQALARNDVETARELWGVQEREQSEANISVHNLAVLAHANALDLEEKMGNGVLSKEQEEKRDVCWAQAFNRWKILLDKENFWSRLTMRIRDLDDPRLTTGMARRMRTSLPLTLLMINAQLAVRAAERGSKADAQRHRQLMNQSGFEQEEIEEAMRRALGPIREMIRSLCRTANVEASANPQRADQVSRWLLEQTQPRLAALDCVLPAGHPTRDSLHDDVAQQMLSCQILFGNRTENWDESLKILVLILPIAVGPFIRTRVEENIQTVKSNLIYDRCWFCQKRKGDKTAAVEVKMCGDVTRTPIFQYGRSGTRIEWKNRTLAVPRCPTCKQAHSSLEKYSWIGAGVGSLVGLGGCIGVVSSSSSDATWGGIFVLLIFAGIGAAIGSAIGTSRLPKGIRPISAMNEFPVIKELKAKGWQMGEKPAGVQ